VSLRWSRTFCAQNATNRQLSPSQYSSYAFGLTTIDGFFVEVPGHQAFRAIGLLIRQVFAHQCDPTLGIAYRAEANHLVILRVLGSAQDWQAILRAVDQ
jgi:hypothetical protein